MGKRLTAGVPLHVNVDGLRELRRDLKKAEQVDDLRELRLGLKKAAGVVAAEAKERIPVRSGRARGSVRASTGGSRAYVLGGKKTVPYYGWLDFGSRSPRSGRARSVGPWKGSGDGPSGGRFIYPALDAKADEVARIVEEAVTDALNKLGL